MLIERALAKNKEQRYTSASELADALRSLRSTSLEHHINLSATVEPSSSDAESASIRVYPRLISRPSGHNQANYYWRNSK